MLGLHLHNYILS